MPMTPNEALASAYELSRQSSMDDLLSSIPQDFVRDLRVIVEKAETQKAVLGVTLTSLLYKTLHPSQDIRLHQEGMAGGYSGRTFDTRFVTPFLQAKFPHFAMAESAWLTRSLEQPHAFDEKFPGKIRIPALKTAFLKTLRHVEDNPALAFPLLTATLAMMMRDSDTDESLVAESNVTDEVSILQIVDAVSRHIHFDYGAGATGTARIPVLAIYAVYTLLMPDVKRYFGKTLAPLESHTSPDARSKALGDIDVVNADGSCFESIEIKHGKPITAGMVDTAYRKIKNAQVNRYYILTTAEPNIASAENVAAVQAAIARYRRVHACQIIVNGVMPSLKYYLRLLSNPQDFIGEYSRLLTFEFQRGSGIKRIHLQAWQLIRADLLRS